MSQKKARKVKILRYLLGSPVLTIGWCSLTIGIIILIGHGAADSSKMSRDAEEFLGIIEAITLLVGVILIIAGLISQWMKEKEKNSDRGNVNP